MAKTEKNEEEWNKNELKIRTKQKERKYKNSKIIILTKLGLKIN